MSNLSSAAPGDRAPDHARQLLLLRLRAALTEALALARAERFIAVLEQVERTSPGDDLARALSPAFSEWRRALRSHDVQAARAAAERVDEALEKSRAAVVERDRAIQAYRLRWACEHAPLRPKTVASLVCFYRLLPYSSPSQSKYEYALTRLFAGALGARRTLVDSPRALVEKVVALERAWGAQPVTLPDADVASVLRQLASFAAEARAHPEPAAPGDVFRRAGAYKAELGEKLYEPRIAVAAVGCSVALGNALCELLAHEARPAEAQAGHERVAAEPAPEPPPAAAPTALESLVEAPEPAAPERPQPTPAAASPAAEEPVESLGTGARGDAVFEAPPPAIVVDIPAVAAAAAAPVSNAGTMPVAEPSLPSGVAPADTAEEPAPQPSPRAAELGLVAENAAVIEAYLKPPRSAEVWQLDLDMFLSPLPGDAEQQLGGSGAARRRALELILASDDLICAGAADEVRLGEEHRARVRDAAKEMAVHGTSLRRLLEKAQQSLPDAIEPLLYVSDHIVWERLRLEASTKRVARKKKISLAAPPRPTTAQERPSRRRFLTAAAVLASTTVAIAALGAFVEPLMVDADVHVLDPKSLPGAEHIKDARLRRSILFLTVGPTWARLGSAEKREHLAALASYGTGNGFDTVSVVDERGEALASFSEGEAMLLSDAPSEAELAAR